MFVKYKLANVPNDPEIWLQLSGIVHLSKRPEHPGVTMVRCSNGDTIQIERELEDVLKDFHQS